MVMSTVGLVVGTGRGGISRAGLSEAAVADGAAAAGGTALAVAVAVARSARGPLLSHPVTSAIATINCTRTMGVILIRDHFVRKLLVALAYALAVGRAGPTQADAGDLRVEMRCERVDAPGRVRCEVEALAPPGESISAGDVVILRTPPFVSALRGRIGPNDATTRDPGVWRWAFALAARARGSGDVDALARLVVCHGARCLPLEAPVKGTVVVGE